MPAASKGMPPPGWLTITDAVAHTGIPPMTLRRRVDAWIRGDIHRISTGYAIRGTHAYGGRIVNQIDAERARRQRCRTLDKAVTCQLWQSMVIRGDPDTNAADAPDWWPAATRLLRQANQTSP